MKLNKLIFPATIALIMGGVMTSAHANAQDRENLTTAQRVDQIMERFDANKDGVLDESDREALRVQRFQSLDKNNDGSLSEEELAEGHEERKERRAERRAKKRDKIVERLDTDGNGVISYEEFSAAQDRRSEGKGDHKGEKRGKRGRRHGGRGGPGGPGGDRILEHADADKDGIVTRAELEAAIENRKSRGPRRSSGS